MDEAILEPLGLSNGESRIYLALLDKGASKAGAIIESTGMASSAVYNALNTLLEKGLISYVKKGMIKQYVAVPPKELVAFIEERKQRLLAALPVLESLRSHDNAKEEAEVFVGFKGVTAMLDIILETIPRGEDNLFFAADTGNNEEMHAFFKKYDARRMAKGVNTKGIANKSHRSLFESRMNDGAKMRIAYTDSPFPSGINIGADVVGITSWGERPVGYLIKSRQVTEMYKKMFYDLWNASVLDNQPVRDQQTVSNRKKMSRSR